MASGQEVSCFPGRGAACGLSIRKELELRVERAVGLGWEQLGTPFLSGSVALRGRKLHAKYTQKSSQISFLERVGIEMGDAKLEKQEEACEILCSLKCWLPVRGRAAACDSSWAAATRSLELRSLRFLSSTSGYSEGVEKDEGSGNGGVA